MTPDADAAMDLPTYCDDLGRRAKAASRTLAHIHGDAKNRWVRLAVEELRRRQDAILTANETDIARAPQFGLSPAQIDRLRLTPARLDAVADGLRQIEALADPVGLVLEGQVRPNGLEIRKVRVPLGVLFFIYESRPNVTADAAALAIKSGNAIILRGGKEALASNQALVGALQEALRAAELPADALQLVSTTDRAAVTHLLRLKEHIDLAIPRGGEALIRLVAEQATMPVLKHYKGTCHVYVDRAADSDMAERIVINAKCQRPGVCNAAESLLVHQDITASFLPRVAQALHRQGVELRGCPRTCALITGAKPATDDDFAAEFLDLIISIKVVADLDEAIRHISRFGSQHTEAIVTNDLAAARRFTTEVDAAAVLVNASTRFHDGFEFGLGAEIGISTDKFHARGPCGVLELMTYKYVVYGDGQVRS
jgi:glutamate-5-semialdehyde dehydrogenase